jgi:transcriptional regulator with XRE-family HTH domain
MNATNDGALPSSIGADLAALRTQAEITQSQLAKEAAFDQSRISRIEKGEVTPSTTDAERLLSALTRLGSKSAAGYTAYLAAEWEYVEKPDFSNPQREVLALAEEELGKVELFLAEDRPWPLKRQLERQRAAIQQSAAYLTRTAHQVAFIGEIGVGKSTAMSFLYGLLEPASPDGRRLERVVLEAGGGRTTICEVNIRRGPAYGLVIQAQSETELRNLVSDFCAGAWIRRSPAEMEKGERVGVSEEIQRAIRNMSGLRVKREQGPDGRNVYRDQAEELAAACVSEEEFRARVIERLRLEARSRREIWIEEGKGVMRQLRDTFKDVNNGRLADVPMPASIDLMIPGFGSELTGLSVSVVDTKGMDEIAVRADLDARLKDSRTTVVLCSTFNQAPMASTQLLLDHLRHAHGQRLDAGKVAILALPRPGEAMGVKDDAGEPPQDDEDGYSLKRDQILRQLGVGDEGTVSGVPIFFFNAHDDDPTNVRGSVFDQVVKLRQTFEERLLDECAAADEIMENHEKQAFTMAVEEVANRLANFLGAHSTLGSRVRPAHQELTSALAEIRYASTIWAMTRRNGEYYNFSASHHVGAGGARDAILRTANWFERLQGVLDTLKQDPDLALASRTIAQVEAGIGAWRRDFAEAARAATIEVYREPLEGDTTLWIECVRQWGAGPGFKIRVTNLLRAWFEKRTDLNDELERIMSTAWGQHVIGRLERLANESSEAEPDIAGNVISFPRSGISTKAG